MMHFISKCCLPKEVYVHPIAFSNEQSVFLYVAVLEEVSHTQRKQKSDEHQIQLASRSVFITVIRARINDY